MNYKMYVVKLHCAIRFSFVNSSRYIVMCWTLSYAWTKFSMLKLVYLRLESQTSIIYIISARQNQKISRFDQSKKRMQLYKKRAQFLELKLKNSSACKINSFHMTLGGVTQSIFISYCMEGGGSIKHFTFEIL